MSYKSFGSLPGGDNEKRTLNNPGVHREFQEDNHQSSTRSMKQQSPFPAPQQQTRVYHPSSQEERDHIIANFSHVIIDHHAEWCKPCKHIQPEFERLALENKNISFLAENIDNTHDWKRPEPITGVPVFHFYHKGVYLKNFKMTGAAKLELNEKVAEFSKLPK